jgi:hypothetical protein
MGHWLFQKRRSWSPKIMACMLHFVELTLQRQYLAVLRPHRFFKINRILSYGNEGLPKSVLRCSVHAIERVLCEGCERETGFSEGRD